MTIMDFGAGSCWTSRFLSQLGLSVIAVDVSATALKIGEELYRRHPIIGNQPDARFVHFDGHSLALADESVDRISCWDAFHHVPNPDQVLKEMARVLKTGGIAGFSEPGPDHSKTPQSQYEMRTNRLIENDVNLDEIWMAAQAAGFTDIKVALFNPKPFLRPLSEFDEYVTGIDSHEGFTEDTRNEMRHRRVFFLFKGEPSLPRDSRQREGLLAELEVEVGPGSIAAGESVELHVKAKNVGTATWLPSKARIGAVRFGVHLFDAAGTLIDLDYYRKDLRETEGQSIAPGESVEFVAEVPLPAAGNYTFQCDLVSEGVCWFEHNGSPSVRLKLEVV
jgi:SAM-dependent methyltransferase